MTGKCKMFVDIDLLFDFRGLQFCYARQHQKLGSSSIKSLYGKSFHQGYSDLNLSYNLDSLKLYIPTVKPHIHSIAVLTELKEQNDLTIISFIEEEIVSLCLANYSLMEGIPVLYILHDELLSVLQPYHSVPHIVYLNHLPTHQTCTTANFKSVHISFPARESCEESYETLWSLYSVPELSYEYRYNLWNSYISLPQILTLEGNIVKGFGRGSSDLGFPTANLEVTNGEYEEMIPGIYAARAYLKRDNYERQYAAAVSVGWNPQYDNEYKTIEAHLIHKFEEEMYGEGMKLELTYYLRAECAFSNFEELIKAIGLDVDITKNLLST